MPVYEYRCPDCASQFEKLVPLFTNGGHFPCPDCGRPADKQFSTFASLGLERETPAAGGGCCGGAGGCACSR